MDVILWHFQAEERVVMDGLFFFIFFGLLNGGILIFRERLASLWASSVVERLRNPENHASRAFLSSWNLDSEDRLKKSMSKACLWSGIINLAGISVFVICLWIFGGSVD